LEKMQQQLQSAPMQQAPQQMEEEMMMQYGGIPIDENGVFATGKNPVVVPTKGTGKISMEGVNFPIDSYDADTMQYLDTMQPNQEYRFEGVDNVLEVPQAKFGMRKAQWGEDVQELMNDRRVDREKEAKGIKQALEEIKQLKKAKKTKSITPTKNGKDFGVNQTREFQQELSDFKEEEIEDVLKKGEKSKHYQKTKGLLKGSKNILLNLVETSPYAQALLQESSVSPTQSKPFEKQISAKTAFNLRKAGYDIPDAMIQGNPQVIVTKTNQVVPNTNTPQTNYFQKPNTPLPNNFNPAYNSTDSTSNYSGNTPVEVIGNSNLRVGNRVDTVGGTPVRDFGITNKNPSRTGEYDFISQLQGKTNRAENIDDYVSWKNEWNDMIPNFASKSYKEQQKAAMDWVKTNKPDVYEGLKNQWEAQGYKKGDSFEGYLKDGMYANITSSLRPSLLNDRVAPIDPLERKPTGLNTKIPTTLPLADIQKKVSVPTIEDDSINPADAIIGKLDNRDMSGRYLSNMKLRNNEIKLPYFGQVDLKTPQLYQQDIAPYVNNLYTGYNAAVQNIDMNSAVGQAQALQLNANLDKSINDVSGSVYNQNLKAAIDWENQLTGIYNRQSQLDNQNRAAYSDGVDQVRTNKQNVDNQIDAMAYEHKMKQIQNQNNMMLSTMLHPDFYTTDEGNGQLSLMRKFNPAPKANPNATSDELEYWKKLALEKNPKAAKYGIGKKKAMC